MNDGTTVVLFFTDVLKFLYYKMLVLNMIVEYEIWLINQLFFLQLFEDSF